MGETKREVQEGDIEEICQVSRICSNIFAALRGGDTDFLQAGDRRESWMYNRRVGWVFSES